MFPSGRPTAIFFLLLAKLHVANGVDTATVSITTDAQYEVEPACVQTCMYDSFPGNDVAEYLLFALGCAGTIYNECYCTQIQDQRASTALSTCIQTLCSGTTEIAPAISLYESYCSVAGYPRNAVASQSATVTQTSSSPASTPISQSATPTPTPSNPSPLTTPPVTSSPPTTTAATGISTSNQSSSSSTTTSTSKSKHNTGAIVGGVVGGLAVLAFIAAMIFFYLRSRRQKSPQTQHHEAAAASTHPPAEQPEKQTTGYISPDSPLSAKATPAAVFKNLARGRAELLNKESETIVNVAPTAAEVNGDGRQALRPNELDTEGRYVGELHGDGRHFTGSELP